MHRLFVAIRPPEDIRDLLLDAMDDSADFRWQDDEQLHLTLRFVGEVERPRRRRSRRRAGRVHAPPFELRIAGTGRFEQRSSGAFGPESSRSEPVAALAAKVERACLAVGLEPERRAFHPHITLARWKGRRTREVARFLDAPAASRRNRSTCANSPCSKAASRATARITRRSRATR